jgi:tRNA wybutosine-synthesizing protein 2
MFAGIGYFTLPMAVYSRPKKIFACEINPIAYDYLCENIILNNITDIVEPLKGDNRLVAPKNVADRVILGYFENTSRFLKTAIDCLKDHKGVIHYHDKISDEDLQNKRLKIVKKINDKIDRSINIINQKHIKSYAPGISHYVFDIGIDEK